MSAVFGLMVLAGCGDPKGEVLDPQDQTAQSEEQMNQGSTKAMTPTLGIGEED